MTILPPHLTNEQFGALINLHLQHAQLARAAAEARKAEVAQ